MDMQILDLSNPEYFVEYPYLQSKRVYEEVVGPLDESNNTPIPLKDNPFAIQYSGG